MDSRRPRKQARRIIILEDFQEVTSPEWKFINMSKQEEDLIFRMYNLVGERWDLIAGRIPGRRAEEVERFWIMRHHDCFAEKRKLHKPKNSKICITTKQ